MEGWGLLCLFLRLPYKRKTIILKRKANEPTDKVQRSTSCVHEGDSKLLSLFFLEPVALTGFTSMKKWLRLHVWPSDPGTKP